MKHLHENNFKADALEIIFITSTWRHNQRRMLILDLSQKYIMFYISKHFIGLNKQSLA